MKKKHPSRRDFSRAVGAAALFAPFVSMLRQAPAQTAARTAKYLLIFYSNGTDTDAWSPAGSTESNVRHSAMTEKLAPLAPNLVLAEKLSSRGTADNHGAPGGLTGFGYSSSRHTSLDQYVADGLRAAGVRTPIPSLLLGGVQNQRQSAFYRDGQILNTIYSPLTAYDTVFGGASPTPGGGGEGDAEAARILRRRQSALDLMRGELTALRGKLGAQERAKLDLHADSFRQLEERLTGPPPGGGGGGECTVPGSPGEGGQDLQKSALHLDIAVQAFACDITRVAAVRFGHHQGTQVSLPEIGSPGDWHSSFIHGDNPRERLVNLERWLCDRFVDAANRLKALPAPDGDGSLFDQTLMVWARDMGDAIGHSGEDMRFVFSGGAGGYLNTGAAGRYVDGSGSAHQQALINCCEAMGVDPSGFADPNGPRAPLRAIGG